MNVIEAIRDTRIYTYPEFHFFDPGELVNQGYILIFRRVISEHRLRIL